MSDEAARVWKEVRAAYSSPHLPFAVDIIRDALESARESGRAEERAKWEKYAEWARWEKHAEWVTKHKPPYIHHDVQAGEPIYIVGEEAYKRLTDLERRGERMERALVQAAARLEGTGRIEWLRNQWHGWAGPLGEIALELAEKDK